MALREDSEMRIRKLAQNELSIKARLGYVALLLAAGAMTVIVVTLWLTEPHAPVRARAAFAVMSVIGISWIGLATWALTTRRVLAARDRVIAGWMAVSFTSLYLLGTLVAVVVSGKASTLGSVAVGALMLGMAMRALRSARRRFAELAARRAELERQLAV